MWRPIDLDGALRLRLRDVEGESVRCLVFEGAPAKSAPRRRATAATVLIQGECEQVIKFLKRPNMKSRDQAIASERTKQHDKAVIFPIR